MYLPIIVKDLPSILCNEKIFSYFKFIAPTDDSFEQSMIRFYMHILPWHCRFLILLFNSCGKETVSNQYVVKKLAMEALQHSRINERWMELDKENEAIKLSKQYNKKYEAIVFENGDTLKQLLAWCRYILAKKQEHWTDIQLQRSSILFEKYPLLHQANNQTFAFRNIYEDRNMESAKARFNIWINDIMDNVLKEFFTVANTVKNSFRQHPLLLHIQKYQCQCRIV